MRKSGRKLVIAVCFLVAFATWNYLSTIQSLDDMVKEVNQDRPNQAQMRKAPDELNLNF